ncbi:hypothetical protein [Noviherbaspirillum sp. ST9]|uniref:hypothetical protein n=1 Tax=Noviherbaspirillum sp. ST9 TaxID=3401606 RepID=UPI003B587FA7
MNAERIEPISRNKRRRTAGHIDFDALAILPSEQIVLLREWLKSESRMRKWDSLLKIAGPSRIETAESLANALAACGAVILEERLAYSSWLIESLAWHDYEAICASLGMSTRTVKRNTFTEAWAAAADRVWNRDALADAYSALVDAAPDAGLARLELLCKLDEWLGLGRSGTRRDFALFARGATKQIKPAEWAWLSECIDVGTCGVDQHAPSLSIAGDVQLTFGTRLLDVGATGDFIALKHSVFDRLTGAATRATHYRLVENRTSFENLAARSTANSAEIIVWLPGYAPGWWKETVRKLLDALPLPSRISCDADPDGVQIVLNAARLWIDRGLEWEAFAMSVDDAGSARHTLPMSERDVRLAQSLLEMPVLTPELASLLQWCLKHCRKAEQENWV